MNQELYEALLEAGASETRARAAAESLSGPLIRMADDIAELTVETRTMRKHIAILQVDMGDVKTDIHVLTRTMREVLDEGKQTNKLLEVVIERLGTQ